MDTDRPCTCFQGRRDTVTCPLHNLNNVFGKVAVCDPAAAEDDRFLANMLAVILAASSIIDKTTDGDFDPDLWEDVGRLREAVRRYRGTQ